MKLNNPIAKITAAIILIFSITAVTGIFGTVEESGKDILLILVGASITFLFVSNSKNNAAN